MTKRRRLFVNYLYRPSEDEAWLPDDERRIVEWRASTRFHDWSENSHAQLRSWMSQLKKLGMIGEIEWYSNGESERFPAGLKKQWTGY